jgi:hypothetical protein
MSVPLAGRTDPKSLEMRLAALESQMAALVRLIAVAPDGSVTIKTQSQLNIEANIISMKAQQSLSLRSGANAELKAGGQLAMEGSATTSVKGALLTLNGGTKPLARVADMVQIPGVASAGVPIPPGQIVAGNPTILA